MCLILRLYLQYISTFIVSCCVFLRSGLCLIKMNGSRILVCTEGRQSWKDGKVGSTRNLVLDNTWTTYGTNIMCLVQLFWKFSVYQGLATVTGRL